MAILKKRMFGEALSVLLLYFALPASVHAQLQGNIQETKTNKVGLALSGGGARGIAHIGVIIALEEEGIPIDMIAGTSMGSIVGGLYACGYSGEDMRRLVSEIDWKALFSQAPEPEDAWISRRYGLTNPIFQLHFKFWEIFFPLALINGQRMNEELFRLTAAANFAAESNFDNLVVPYRAVAVDIATGKVFALGKGSLSQAIRASTAIPMYYFPALFEDHLLVDGGVLDVLPTDVVKEMGADVIIGVDIKGTFPIGKEPKNFVEITSHTINIMVKEMEKQQMTLADVMIEPDLRDHSSMEYANLEPLIQYGYEATKQRMEDIKKAVFGVSKNSRGQSRPPRRLDKEALGKAAISKVQIIGHDIYASGLETKDGVLSKKKIISPQQAQARTILSYFLLKEGQLFNMDQAIKGMERIYATGQFQNIWLELDALDENRVSVNLHFIEQSNWRLGIGMNHRSEEGVGGFAKIIFSNLLGMGDRLEPVFRLGRLRRGGGLEFSLGQILSTPFDMMADIIYEKECPYIYDPQGNRLTNLSIDRLLGQFSLGCDLSKSLLVKMGLLGERVELEENSVILQPSLRSSYWKLLGQLVFDSTESRYFPTEGIFCRLEYITTLEAKKQGSSFAKFTADFMGSFSIAKKHVLIPFAKLGISQKSLPLYEQFRLGGPLDLPGYHRWELWANHTLVLGAKYRWNFFKKLNLEASWSAANGFHDRSDIKFKNLIRGASLGLSSLSPLGPVSFVYGRSESKRDQLYLSIGYDF